MEAIKSVVESEGLRLIVTTPPDDVPSIARYYNTYSKLSDNVVVCITSTKYAAFLECQMMSKTGSAEHQHAYTQMCENYGVAEVNSKSERVIFMYKELLTNMRRWPDPQYFKRWLLRATTNDLRRECCACMDDFRVHDGVGCARCAAFLCFKCRGHLGVAAPCPVCRMGAHSPTG